MYSEPNAVHKKPHIHAIYSGEDAVISFDGEVLEGSLPANKLKLVQAWMVIHREDLEANWELLSKGEESFRIDPLK